jgi:hypothetical protein
MHDQATRPTHAAVVQSASGQALDANLTLNLKKNMDWKRTSTRRLRASLGTALLALVVPLASSNLAFGADTKEPNGTAKGAEAKQQKPKKLTGAELYAIHCNRCHPERYATEWTAGQWKTLITHMRVRANLPATQAREILKFLQEDSGS